MQQQVLLSSSPIWASEIPTTELRAVTGSSQAIQGKTQFSRAEMLCWRHFFGRAISQLHRCKREAAISQRHEGLWSKYPFPPLTKSKPWNSALLSDQLVVCMWLWFLIFFFFFICNRSLSLTSWSLDSLLHAQNPTQGDPQNLPWGAKVITFAFCLCGADKNLKGLSQVTRENVMVFGTFKTIYFSCVILSSAHTLRFHSQSPPAISQYTANKIKLLLLSQSQSGSSTADKDWKWFFNLLLILRW